MAAFASSNGHGAETWREHHLRLERPSRGHCRVTFDHPPANTLTAATVAELAEVVGLIEQDPDLNVVVFDSANPDVYLAGDDTERGSEWLDLLVRLSRAPVVSIAAIRGLVVGAGSEFVLACDLRFASREKAVLATGIGSIARLSRLVGHGRALEIVLVAGDLDGPRAERYGYVNRLVADERLDEEVDAIAARIARFDHDALARTKASADRAA